MFDVKWFIYISKNCGVVISMLCLNHQHIIQIHFCSNTSCWMLLANLPFEASLFNFSLLSFASLSFLCLPLFIPRVRVLEGWDKALEATEKPRMKQQKILTQTSGCGKLVLSSPNTAFGDTAAFGFRNLVLWSPYTALDETTACVSPNFSLFPHMLRELHIFVPRLRASHICS